MKKFIEELKRRNVIKASLAYLVIAWILLQVATTLLDIVHSPEWVIQAFTGILILGLPIWIIISWVYDITPQGIEKTAKVSENELVTQVTNKRLNAFIIISLSIAVIVMGLKLSNFFSDSDKQYAIAVMPFSNIQIGKGNELLSESFSHDVYSYISQMSKLQVSDFYSGMRYKKTDKTNAEIGKELNVTYLLRGTVRQSGNKLNIIIDLIDAKSNKKIWTETYDEVFEENTLDIQQLVSQKIVEKLKIQLTPQEEKTLKRKPTENVEALYLFTKGREFAVQRRGGITRNKSIENLEKSIEYFQKAVALDSTYAEAYAELAHSYFLVDLISGDYAYKNKIDFNLEKATELNANLFRVYAVKAMMIQGTDWKKGGEYFEKSIALNPNDASVHMQYKMHLEQVRPIRDYEKGLIHIRIAQKLDPFVNQKNQQLFNHLLESGEIEEAEELLNKYGFKFPKSSLRIKKANLIVYKNKDWTEFIRFYETEIEKDPSNADLYKELGVAYNGILNDDINFIKYAKKAYELDSTNSDNVDTYFFALTEGKKFAAAKKLMQSKNFKLLKNEKWQLNYLFYYYYHQENYRKAQEILKDSLAFNFYTQQLYTYAQLGDRKPIDREFKEYAYSDRQKAFVYAILKERDSMYYYLGRMNRVNGIRWPNSRREFDPYRKEERYKAFLKKNYLPITHWNE